MEYKPQILLGKISKSQGYDGTLSVKLEKELIDNFELPESVFLEIEGKPVPFFISSSEYQGGDVIKLKFEGYESIDKVIEFTGCRVFLTSVTVNHRVQKNEPGDIIGFKVYQDKNLLGTISEIIPNPGHDLLKIVSPGKKEILIPFHEDFIVNFNNNARSITVDLPEGLTEIN